MKTTKSIFLVGLMGAGKTTIGRQLATRLNYDFFDSDHEVEQRCGADIPWIFDVEGEAGFRKRESLMIDELTQRAHIVLATGGGAVLSEQNRESLRSRGLVIYLRASVDRLYERTARDRSRPLLQTEDPRAKLEELLLQREPLYRDVADFTVNTDRGSVNRVVGHILGRVRHIAKREQAQA
ncbi:MAG: shikimate kinase [Gammaproteobacteria bacterium SG8_47]|nr:MAG: shikimate kinase [Gammaproteobacteria bacterium SG8_47]